MKNRIIHIVICLFIFSCTSSETESDLSDYIKGFDHDVWVLELKLKAEKFPKNNIQVALFYDNPIELFEKSISEYPEKNNINNNVIKKVLWNGIFKNITGDRIQDLSREGILLTSTWIDKSDYWIVSKAEIVDDEIFVWCQSINIEKNNYIKLEFNDENIYKLKSLLNKTIDF